MCRREEQEQFFKYNTLTGDWSLQFKPDAAEAISRQEWGTDRIDAAHLIERVLNGKLIEINDKVTDDDGKEHEVRNAQATIAAQDKASQIQRKFQDWIWSDPDRTERLTRYYNDTFNNYRPRTFDGSHQVLPGITERWSKLMHSHQRDAIWRVVEDRTALLAHEVGFGKTAVMVASGMELKRLGLADKVLYVVPKATHPQFKQQFQELYPYANILYPSEDDFTAEKRPEFISRAITGDWDAIILSDTQFRRIPVRPETEIKFMKDEIETIKEVLESTEDKRTQKEIEKALKRAAVRLEELTAKTAEVSDKTVYFEDMGIDQMYVDEADGFKNLHFTTQMGRIKGLPNSESDRAWDMYEKVRYLQDRDNKTGIVFATGTPVANTIAEMYTMMRYLQEPMLEEKGLKHFDAWAKTFGDTTESLEQTPTGAYKLTQRFAKFANAPELSSLWQQVADIRVADEVPEMVEARPHIVDENGKSRRTVISVPPDPALLAYMKTLAERADNLKNVDPTEDNMLKISSDARKASLDMRLVDAHAPVNASGKVTNACNKITEIYNETTPDKGTQSVFLDMGTPKAKDKVADTEEPNEEIDEDTAEEAKLLTNVYANIKAQLIANGVPADQIAFIHDAQNDKQKKALSDKVNSGDIRVLIGSTGKMGAGLNVQKRAAALHHLDAPWRPRDIEQREGRVIRQGNEVYGPKKDAEGNILDPGQGVRIYTYVTERSFDAYMWQAIEAKSKAIKAIMRRSAPPRAIEDIDSFTMSASEAKAVASGDPDVLKDVTLKNSITRFQMLRSSWVDARVRANDQLRQLPAQIKTITEEITKQEQDAKAVKDEEKFAMKVNGVPMTERPAAGDAILEAIKKGQFNQDIAQYRGLEVKVQDMGPQAGYKLVVYNPATGQEYTTNPIPYAELTSAGAITRIDNKVNSVKTDLEKNRAVLKSLEASVKTYTEQAAKPFEYQERLDQMQKELSRLEKKLQGQKVEEPETPSDLYTEELPEDTAPAYRWTSKKDEVVNPAAEIAAVKAEVAPVEKTLEVKPPSPSIENIVEKMAEPRIEQVPVISVSTENKPVKEMKVEGVQKAETETASPVVEPIVEKTDKNEIPSSERKQTEKRLKEINQAKDLAYDMAVNDKGAALKKLEAEEQALQAKLHPIKEEPKVNSKTEPLIGGDVLASVHQHALEAESEMEKNTKAVKLPAPPKTGEPVSKIEALRQAYKEELRHRLETDPEYNWPDKSDAAVETTVNKMIASISKKGDRSDWLKYNDALKVASKKVGIKSSPELRNIFQAQPGLQPVVQTEVNPPMKETIEKLKDAGRLEIIPITGPTPEAPKEQPTQSTPEKESTTEAVKNSLPNIRQDVEAVNHAEESRLSRLGGTGKMNLLPKELAAKFPNIGSTEKIPEADKVVIAKFFHPLSHQTWYAVEYNPKDREFFGYVDTGDYDSEWGYFSLDEMNSLNVKGLGMERDLYFKPQEIKNVLALQDKDFVIESKGKEEDKPTKQQDASDKERVSGKAEIKATAALPATQEKAKEEPILPPAETARPLDLPKAGAAEPELTRGEAQKLQELPSGATLQPKAPLSEEIGRYTIKPSGTWKVKLPDGTERTFSYENDAQQVAQKHLGATVAPTGNWSAGRMIAGAWNGHSFATREEAVAQARKWTSTEPVPAKTKPSLPTTKSPTRQPKKLLEASAITDFQRGRDVIIRKGDRTFVHDTQGEHADIEVASDRLTPGYKANLFKLTPEQRKMAVEVTSSTPYLSEEGRQERLNILKEIEPKIKVEAPPANIAKEGGVKPQRTKTEAVQPKVAVKENEPIIEKVKPKGVVIPHGHGPHHITHGISASENAAIHAWYHEHPEKNREAEQPKEEGTKPKTKPAHAIIREAVSGPSSKGISIRNLKVKEPNMREKVNSKRPKPQVTNKPRVKDLGGGIVETNYGGHRRRHLKL